MSDHGAPEKSDKVASRDYLDGFLRDGVAEDSIEDSPKDPNGDAVETSIEASSETSNEATGADPDGALRLSVIEQIRTIYDPEIPVNIYDLGLIYAVDVEDGDHVVVTMTLTTPHCPVAEIMPAEVESSVRQVVGVGSARVNLVWDPPWDPSRMTEAAQLELGFL